MVWQLRKSFESCIIRSCSQHCGKQKQLRSILSSLLDPHTWKVLSKLLPFFSLKWTKSRTTTTGMVHATTMTLHLIWNEPPSKEDRLPSINIHSMAAARKPYAIRLMPLYLDWRITAINSAAIILPTKSNGTASLIDHWIPAVNKSSTIRHKEDRMNPPAISTSVVRSQNANKET